MGRQVQLRTSYMNDSRFLLRLIEALAKDPKMAKDRRERVISWLKAAQQELVDEYGTG